MGFLNSPVPPARDVLATYLHPLPKLSSSISHVWITSSRDSLWRNGMPKYCEILRSFLFLPLHINGYYVDGSPACPVTAIGNPSLFCFPRVSLTEIRSPKPQSDPFTTKGYFSFQERWILFLTSSILTLLSSTSHPVLIRSFWCSPQGRQMNFSLQ